MPQPLCFRPALNPIDISCSTQIQDWLSPCGTAKSKPANTPDAAVSINNNTLRSQIRQGCDKYEVTCTNSSAGNHYSASTLVDYWAEEQVGTARHRLKPVSLVPPLRSTEYQVSTSTPATARLQQLQHCYLGDTIKASSSSSSLPTTCLGEGRAQVDSLERSCSSTCLSSAGQGMAGNGGWSPKLHSHRGNATARAMTPTGREYRSITWLDSCGPGASIAATTLQQQKLEFQKTMPGDPRAKLLAVENRYKARDAEMAIKCRERLQERQGLTKQWKSVYALEYLQPPFVAAHEKPKAVWPNSEK